MVPLKTLTFIYLLLAPLNVLCTGLQHNWVSWDGASEPSDDLPVLHTAFVQTGEELHYFSESTRYETDLFVGHRVHQDQNGKTSCKERKYIVRRLATEDSMPFEFDPPFLDFGDCAVAVPAQRRVTVRNRLNKPVILDSIMGESASFHCSFFDVQEIPALGEAGFDVAFLPREEGVESTVLSIHTSAGIFIFEASGRSTSNPYRIVPFVGNRISYNSTLTRDIVIHNPYSETLRIEEIISSGGNVHTELAHDVDPALAGEPLQYWDIRPYQTRTIGRIRIIGHMTEVVTTFVRVVGVLLDETGKAGDSKELMLSVPVQVLKKAGVFNSKDLLDFGMLRQGERSPHELFSVYTFGIVGKLEFETLYVEKGDASGIYMEFATNPPISVYSGNDTSPGPTTDLVKVFFDASRISFSASDPVVKFFSGRIIAVSRGGNYNITVPFRASVYQGDLFPVSNDLAIQDDLKPPHRRSVRIRNALPFGVAVWNISISPDARQYFTVRLFNRTTVIPKGEERPVFLLKYNKKVPDTFGSAVVYVQTNVSTYRLQLGKYSGNVQIDLFSVEEDVFDFGLVEKNDTRAIRFAIRNPNRALMTVRGLQVPNTAIHRLYLVGMLPKGVKALSAADEYRHEWEQGLDLEIPPEQSALFDFELRAPLDGLVTKGSFVIATDLKSNVFPVVYEIGSGSLASIPDALSFGHTHPGKVVYRNLQIFNSFSEDMSVTRLSTITRDPRFFFEGFDPTNPPVLRSGRLTNLGRVMFMPEAPCVQEYCYLGLQLVGTDGQWFIHGLTLPANLAEVDSYLYKKQRARFDNLVKEGKHRVNTTVVVDTDKAKNIKIASSAEMVWPRLLTRDSVHFPLTALGNFTIVNLTLTNPSSMPVVVQVIPLVIYPDADSVVELFREHLLTPLTSEVEMNETLMFSLRDTELFTLKPDSPVPSLREELEGIVPQTVPRFTLSLLLKPHMSVRLRLGFLPSDYTLRSSLLLIRNNLTIMEPVVVYGRGARIGMQVDNLNARTKQPLLFEIRHDHLTDCNNPKRLMHKLHSTLTVRRSFIVNNTGEVPFTVVNMSINGWPCENRGFNIINCFPFRLNPNESYSLELAYTPDFLTSANEADLQLYMHMNGSSWTYPLMATVPADMMARCHRALPRPPFENLMYYSCVTALVFCLICVLACAYLEGDRAIACAIREHYTASRTVFDLNNLDTSSLSAAGRRSSAGSAVQAPDDQGIVGRLIARCWQNWDAAAPSGVHIAADASLPVRTFYSFANKAIRAVHFVWRWTLVYRTKEEPQTNNTGSRRRRRAPLPVPAAKDKAEAPSANVEKSSPKSVEQAKPAAKITLQNNNIRKPAAKEKLSSSVSVSPKPTVMSKAEQKMENQRKKSAAEAEKRLARAQLMMDDFSSTSRENKGERPASEKKTANGKSVNRSDGTSATGTSIAPAAVSQSSVKSKPPRPVLEMPTTPDGHHRPLTAVQPEMSSPMTVTIPPAFSMRDYGEYEMSPDHNRPVTPTPSLASSFGFGQRLPSSHTDSTATSRDHSVGRLDIPRRRNPSEGELSVASELSNAPDWFDESIVSGDVDDDFSAYTAPTDMMSGSGSEFDGESDEKKRKARRGRRGRRLNGGSSESSQEKKAAAHSAGSEKVMGLADQLRSERRQREEDYRQQQERQRLNTISDWPIPELPPLRSLYETEEHQNVPAMWPPTPVSSLPSLAPGTDWMSATAQWSQAASTSGTSGTSAAALGSQWGEAYNPLSLGLSLGPSLMHGSLFSGQDFSLWSENTTLDTDTSWAHMGEPEEEKH